MVHWDRELDMAGMTSAGPRIHTTCRAAVMEGVNQCSTVCSKRMLTHDHPKHPELGRKAHRERDC